MTTARRLELRAKPATSVAGAPEALRYELAEGPLLVARMPEGTTMARCREVAAELGKLADSGAVVVLPFGYAFEVLELEPASSAPPRCGSCDGPLDVDRRCTLCEPRRPT